MDSVNLMAVNKNEKKSFIIKKGNKIKLIDIVLIILIFFSILIIYLIFNLKRSLNKITYILSNTFFNSSNQEIIKNIMEKVFIQNINNLNENSYNNIKKLKYQNICNDNIFEEYINRQNNFCDYSNKYYESKYEELITLTNFSFKGLSYELYVYKKNDNYMSNYIIKTGKYESLAMSNFLEALQYYGKKNNILNNKDIFMLDLGGNIGAHTSFLGRFGYSILTFEASPRNYYILNKNYCKINRNSNIILINKGISNVDKTCNYYTQMDGIGNGILLCNENENKIKIGSDYFNKTFEVILTKLSNYIPYLSKKRLALIKLDIEGSEGKAIEDGIELIKKIHVPFIFSELNINMLKKQGTEPKQFLQMFIDNGYKISREGFFSKSYININEIYKSEDLYFIYDKNR